MMDTAGAKILSNDNSQYQQVDDNICMLPLNLNILVKIEEGCGPVIADEGAFAAQVDATLYHPETGFEYEFENIEYLMEDIEFVLLNSNHPNEPGLYTMIADIELAYDMSGLDVEHTFETDNVDVYHDRQYMTDNLHVSFNNQASRINSIQYIPSEGCYL